MRAAVHVGDLSPRLTFSPAVRNGSLIFVSGTTAVDEDGVLQHPGDVVGQTRFIYEKIRRVLAAASCGLDDVVMTREYITTTDGYKDTAKVRRELFTLPYPAATGVVVAGLLRPGALIEIEAIAQVEGAA